MTNNKKIIIIYRFTWFNSSQVFEFKFDFSTIFKLIIFKKEKNG